MRRLVEPMQIWYWTVWSNTAVQRLKQAEELTHFAQAVWCYRANGSTAGIRHQVHGQQASELPDLRGREANAHRQSRKDSGDHAPFDRIGGVICSDLKGPITPVDRRKNRYLVNFVDYKTKYCRVFLAKTKDEAAKKFEAFLAFF
jgi:hypothetical protein